MDKEEIDDMLQNVQRLIERVDAETPGKSEGASTKNRQHQRSAVSVVTGPSSYKMIG